MPSTLTTEKLLSHLLVLTPTAAGLVPETEVTIDNLVDAGARKVRSSGNSCVAMHRCQVAGKARTILHADPSLHVVLWLDGDMVVTTRTVEQLVELTLNVAGARPLPDDISEATDPTLARMWRLRNAPAMSGSYVKRNAPEAYAARMTTPHLLPLIVMETDGPAGHASRHMLQAVVAGMGALCQTREAFLEHCAEAHDITNRDGTGFPGITASGPAKDTQGDWAWGSEDYAYCSWEWQRGRGVYLAQHLPFGHVRQSVAWPTEQTVLEE